MWYVLEDLVKYVSCLNLPTGLPLVGNLRTRLLALHVLEAVLPACESGVEDDQMAQVWLLHNSFKKLMTFLIFSTEV